MIYDWRNQKEKGGSVMAEIRRERKQRLRLELKTKRLQGELLPQVQEEGLCIYTDGACFPNPGRGGWGWVVMAEGKVVQSSCGGERETSNNRMEMTAILEALKAQADGSSPTIVSDSQYAINGCTRWRAGWERSRFKQGRILNVDLWLALHSECDRVRPTFKWVRGHTGNPANEAADQMANEGRRTLARTPDPRSDRDVDRIGRVT